MGYPFIVEVRTYHITGGKRSAFVELFHQRARPAQEACGMGILGPFLDLQDPEAVIWLRSFPSLKERDRLRQAFYEGRDWTSDLERLVTPLLQDYSVVVARASRQALQGSLVPPKINR